MIVGDKEEIRKEATVPVQSRIDIRTLAEVCQYFADEGALVSTASQLVSWSLEVLVETLKRNGKVRPEKPSIESAYQFLESNGLMQKRMKRRKLTMARGFEELRMEGIDPKMYTEGSGEYKSIHNNPNWTGKMPKVDIPNEESPVVSKATIEEGVRIYNEKLKEERRENAKKEMERIKANADIDENGVITPHGFGEDFPNGIVDEEYMEKIKEDQRVIDEAEKEKRKKIKAVKKRNKERERIAKRMEELGDEEDEGEDDNDRFTVRKRSDEEILAERIRKDKKQDEILKDLNEIPTDGIKENNNE